MKTQDNHKDEAHIPMRFRILIYALEKGATQIAFMQAYNEILSTVEETECDLSPEMRQSMVEHQVWTKFFPDETSPPPLEFPVAEGYFDPPVSRRAVEQYRIWQMSYLDSCHNQRSDSEPHYNKMQQSGSIRPIPDIRSEDCQLRHSSNDLIRAGVGGCQLGWNIQSQPYASFQSSTLQDLQQPVDTNIVRDAKPSFAKSISPVMQHEKRVDAGSEIVRNNSTRLIDHMAPTSEENVHAKLPQSARTYEGVMHNSEIIPTGDLAMDDLTVILRVDEGGASTPNQSIRPSRSTSSMIDHFNQQLNETETPNSQVDLFNGEMLPV
ncbi:hypothetical protein BELL_0511g00050 [Botrytis elliptica]|uniref:Uncharacterized protein n=1 Tax=Botrytis elliptica TaxID=278938 RepID=A0A4Z1JL20_9HELO|nr:hypothetical protein EAE99_011091 [Botrytis elliptica]TGO71932.1 hypothetical protein BELL_0511g00050 [Botrytis elliptica]